MNDRAHLDSWKDIATYLRRDVRTVIRWEQERGLPVHRVPGGRGTRVFAYPDELDAWLAAGKATNGGESPVAQPGDTVPAAHASRSTRQRASLIVLSAALGAAVVAAAMVGWSTLRPTPAPAQLQLVGGELLALDSSSARLWSHRFTTSGLEPTSERWSQLRDVDGNGEADVIAAVQIRDTVTKQHAGQLWRFSAAGQPQWSASVGDRLTFGEGEYGPPWTGAETTTFQIGQETRIAWAVHHFTWWPSMLLTFGPSGARIGTFVNSGWIRGAAPSPDGRHLVVTGISNSRRAYVVAVLDAASPTGRSPEASGSPFECRTCPAGDPLAYFVLPRTDVGLLDPFPGDGPSVVTFEDGRIELHVLENRGPDIATVIYALSDLTIGEARFSNSFWEWHRLQRNAGRITHDEEDCPHRAGLAIERWTRDSGWRIQIIAAR